MESVAVLIMSCDKNTWLLNPFFETFFRMGGNNFKNIYLSIEKKNYKYKSFDITVINEYEQRTWCYRMKKALQHIEQELVLILLDDFILEKPINFDILNRYIMYMKKDNLNNIILTPVENELNCNDSIYKELYHRNRYGRYKTSLQCGLWNKQILLDLINENESAWEFEIFGNIRSFLLVNKFYAIKSIAEKPLEYNDGFLMIQGKVNLDEKERLEKLLGINIKGCSVQGFREYQIRRDNIKCFPRLSRRLKIIWMYCCFRVKSYFIK